jgi:hypothetical protein
MSANTYYNRDGNKSNSVDLIPELGGRIPNDVDISGYTNSFIFIYASPKLEFSGNAQYLFIIALNFTTTSLGVGLGELTSGRTIVRRRIRLRCYNHCSLYVVMGF